MLIEHARMRWDVETSMASGGLRSRGERRDVYGNRWEELKRDGGPELWMRPRMIRQQGTEDEEEEEEAGERRPRRHQ